MKKVLYSKELMSSIINDCYSFSELCRKLGILPKGSNLKTVRKKLEEFNIDYTHFTGKSWQKNTENPIYTGKYLPKLCEHSSLSSSNVKNLIFKLKLKKNICEVCGISTWLGKHINCELHHINGDSTDNRIENLLILCPNCHSLTDNFRNKNRKIKYS